MDCAHSLLSYPQTYIMQIGGNVINAKMNVLMMAGVVRFWWWLTDKILHICDFCKSFVELCYATFQCDVILIVAHYYSSYYYVQSVMKRFSTLQKVIKKNIYCTHSLRCLGC